MGDQEVLQVEGKVLTIRDRMVLRDMSGKPVAVLLAKMLALKPTFYIYGVEPKLPGQEASGEDQDGVKLYSWAYVTPKCCSIPPCFEMYQATGNNQYEELAYTASALGICNPRMTIQREGKGGAALVERATVQFMFKNTYELTVAVGIDPALMICYVAAI